MQTRMRTGELGVHQGNKTAGSSALNYALVNTDALARLRLIALATVGAAAAI